MRYPPSSQGTLYPVIMTLSHWLGLAMLLGISPVLTAQAGGAGSMQEQGAGMHHDHAVSQPSTLLTVQAGGKTLTLSLADLQTMPQTIVSVFNGHSKQNESYSGPMLADVLARAGVTLDEKTQHAVLDSYVLAGGTDGYFVVFSGAELQPGLHKAQVIVAITQAGQLLTRSGAFQLIDSEDAKPARWVRNLNALTVMPVSSPTR